MNLFSHRVTETRSSAVPHPGQKTLFPWRPWRPWRAWRETFHATSDSLCGRSRRWLTRGRRPGRLTFAAIIRLFATWGRRRRVHLLELRQLLRRQDGFDFGFHLGLQSRQLLFLVAGQLQYLLGVRRQEMESTRPMVGRFTGRRGTARVLSEDGKCRHGKGQSASDHSFLHVQFLSCFCFLRNRQSADRRLYLIECGSSKWDATSFMGPNYAMQP